MYINCFECQKKKKLCLQLVVFRYGTGKSMNNVLSYCGLVDARISKEWTGKKIYLNFSSIFGDFLFEIF